MRETHGTKKRDTNLLVLRRRVNFIFMTIQVDKKKKVVKINVQQ